MRLAGAAGLLAGILSGAAAQPPEIRGINLTLTAADPKLDYTPFLREIAETGANAVSFLIPYYQQDHESVEIYSKTGKTPSLELVGLLTTEARNHGLKVMYLPIALLEDDTSDEWRGTLEPADLDAWFQSWETTLTRLAKTGERSGASILSAGSEFASLEKHELRWRSLVTSLRTDFSGQIIYTANWDTLDFVEWWDAVDAAGLSAYYELAHPWEVNASVAELTVEAMRWRDWTLKLKAEAAPGIPIIFSEFGFPSIDGGAALPWDYTQPGPHDWEEQRRGLEGFIRAWDGEPQLRGAFYYTWVEFRGEPERGYSPRGKPAAELLEAWYRGR